MSTSGLSRVGGAVAQYESRYGGHQPRRVSACMREPVVTSAASILMIIKLQRILESIDVDRAIHNHTRSFSLSRVDYEWADRKVRHGRQ